MIAIILVLGLGISVGLMFATDYRERHDRDANHPL